jgi:hypothetical protein
MAEKMKEPSWAVRIAIGGPLVIATLYLVAIGAVGPSKVDQFGQLGDAFAPLTVAFSIAAVAVALRSVELQREELRLQRLELKANREEMKAQREEFERTARAQEELAKSQARLSSAQERANQLSAEATAGQHALAIATLASAVAHIETVIGSSTASGKLLGHMLEPTRAALQHEIANHRKAIAEMIKRPEFDRE